MMGQTQPAKDSTEITWIGKDRMRVEEGDRVTIVRADQKKMYVLDAKAKTYSVLDLPVDIKKYVPAEAAKMMEPMMETNHWKTTPEPTKMVINDKHEQRVTIATATTGTPRALV
jgi:hypothetical protein